MAHRAWNIVRDVRDPSDERGAAYLFGVPRRCPGSSPKVAPGGSPTRCEETRPVLLLASSSCAGCAVSFADRQAEYQASHGRSAVGEVTTFIRTLLARKLRGARDAS